MVHRLSAIQFRSDKENFFTPPYCVAYFSLNFSKIGRMGPKPRDDLVTQAYFIDFVDGMKNTFRNTVKSA